jgi:hypothetical protein
MKISKTLEEISRLQKYGLISTAQFTDGRARGRCVAVASAWHRLPRRRRASQARSAARPCSRRPRPRRARGSSPRPRRARGRRVTAASAWHSLPRGRRARVAAGPGPGPSRRRRLGVAPPPPLPCCRLSPPHPFRAPRSARALRSAAQPLQDLPQGSPGSPPTHHVRVAALPRSVQRRCNF